MNSLSLLLGAVYFAFQIYGDFQGTRMALGMSKLFGIDLLRNFNYPYFSEILLNSGANGIFRRPGFGLCTFLWAEAVEHWHENKKYVYHFFW
jgi:hypothetical protein